MNGLEQLGTDVLSFLGLENYALMSRKQWVFTTRRKCSDINHLTYPLTASSSILLCSPLPSGTLAKSRRVHFPDVVFPPLFLSVLSSSPFHCALQDGFGQTWWTGDMSIPLQLASLYDGQVFVWSDCLLDFGTVFLLGNMVFVRDA